MVICGLALRQVNSSRHSWNELPTYTCIPWDLNASFLPWWSLVNTPAPVPTEQTKMKWNKKHKSNNLIP